MTEQVNTAPPPPPGAVPPPPPAAAKPPAPPAAQAAPALTPADAPAASAAPTPPVTGEVQDVSDKTLLIPLNMIDILPGQQHRISRDDAKYQELKASIRAGGQNDAAKVMKNGQRYSLVYGHGRFQALRELNVGKIRAELFHGNHQEAAILALSENVNREELNPIEIALGIREATKRGASLQEVAIALGKIMEDGQPNVVWVEQHLELLNLDQKQRDEVANGMMSQSTARQLTKMSNDNRAAVIEEMEKIVEGEKKPRKSAAKKSAAAAADGTVAPPPPPKKTGAALAKAKEKVSGKSQDKFVGTRVARKLYDGIKKLDDQFIPTEESAVRKEMLAIIDYLLGKRKTMPLQIEVE